MNVVHLEGGPWDAKSYATQEEPPPKFEVVRHEGGEVLVMASVSNTDALLGAFDVEATGVYAQRLALRILGEQPEFFYEWRPM